MNGNWSAVREQRERGHVAKVLYPYLPRQPGLSNAARKLSPRLCVFHDDELGPRAFIAFGGIAGLEAAIELELGGLVNCGTNKATPHNQELL